MKEYRNPIEVWYETCMEEEYWENHFQELKEQETTPGITFSYWG